MEISAPAVRPRQWRAATLVVCGIAAFQLLLLLIIFGGVFSRTSTANAKSPAAKNQRIGRAEPKHPRLARTQTKVLVLNGNGLNGAASDEAALLHTRGYPVVATANAPRSDFARTLVMYRPGFRGEGERLGRDFHIARVSALDGLRPRDLQGADVVVIIGNS